MIIQIQNKSNNQQIKASYRTLTRIEQQYNMSTKRTTKRKSTTMSVDDNVLPTCQTFLNDIYIKYDDYSIIPPNITAGIEQCII